jgi:hypothetical protein
MMFQPPRPSFPGGISLAQLRIIEQKAVQSPKSLFAWEKALLDDQRRRRRHRRLSKNAVNLAADSSELE